MRPSPPRPVPDVPWWASAAGCRSWVAPCAIRTAWRQQATEIIDEAFELDLVRIEAVISAIWRLALGTERGANGQLLKDKDGNTKGPNLWAIDRLVVLLGRKAAMLGYDAPARVVIKDLRRMAEDEGIDPADVLAEAERIIASSR